MKMFIYIVILPNSYYINKQFLVALSTSNLFRNDLACILLQSDQSLSFFQR